MTRRNARKPLTSLVIRLAGGRRLRLTLRPRPRISRLMLALLAGALGAPVYALDGAALPQGGQVSAGQASIAQQGTSMTIQQGSHRAVLNWQSFNIGRQAQVEFVQPSSAAVALNRVVGNEGSQIHGRIKANGQVFLSNPNGVIFAPGSEVNVGGLVATTLNLNDQQFMQGQYSLEGGSQAEIRNDGQIRADGSVALVAATVRNIGSIQAGGDVALAAGQRVGLDLHGDGLLSLNVEASALRGQVENGAAIQAGRQVLLTAAAADDLIGSVVNNTGIVKASGLSVEGGRISLSGGLVSHTGTLDASGGTGGQIEISAHTLQDAGQTRAEGRSGQGGRIGVEAQQITQTRKAHMSVDGQTGGGQIQLQGGGGETGRLYSSATLSSQGLGDTATGGEISLTASATQLRAAQLGASGEAGGGLIQVGGGWQGQDAGVVNARETGVNASTRLSADARQTGDGGTVVVWSDEKTIFAGHISATGGSQSGNGGQLEVSGKENLIFAGTVDTASPLGLGGSLLLDPKNITISDAASLFDVLNLDDPNAGAGNQFGYYAEEVGDGNIAVTAHWTEVGGVAKAGAAYLFDSETGALLASLYGSAALDQVGSSGITVLGDGAYVLKSHVWDNGNMIDAGAATYGASGTGVSGVVSAANSLVGSSDYDRVGIDVVGLNDGAYVVSSRNWNDGFMLDVGAATYGMAGVGISGVISASNSLVGSTGGDQVGRVVALSDGAYVVVSSSWDGEGFANAGAVTYGAAGVALTGTISSSNSLIGRRPNDSVGSGGVKALVDGAYVVLSPIWNDAGVINAGAVTYGAAGVALVGMIDASNSLVGSQAYDTVGSAVHALSDGAYVVGSYYWDNAGFINAGAITYGAAGTALTGTISAINSLVGNAANDRIGQGGVTVLADGAYVVRSPYWDNAGVMDAGAVTYGAAGTALNGTINASNSLVGTQASDNVGAVAYALDDGAYVVASPGWDNGGIANAGAATYGAAGTALTGEVSASNSLVGGSVDDQVGSVFALSNGAYVVSCPRCDYAGFADVGAITYGATGVGVTGVIDAANSLVGSQAHDRVGSGGITALRGGAYVVVSPDWDLGNLADVGAVTYGAAGTALKGGVDSTNSLVGSTPGDRLGLYDGSPSILALDDGGYVVRSNLWNRDGIASAGAVSYGAAGTGLAGIVSAGNSLMGNSPGDNLGYRGLAQLVDGRVLIRSPNQTVNGVNTGRVSLVDFNPVQADLAFADSPADDVSIHPDRIAAILNSGTSITLQASNDITLASELLVNNASGDGGHLTLQAGRNIHFDANLTTDSGDLTAMAGDPGAQAAQREAGTPTLTLANGVTLDVGTGTATLAATGGNFINNGGAILTSGAGRYLIYSSDPAASLEGMSGYSKHYNQSFALGSVPAYAGTGNWFLYSLAPVLNVTPGSSAQVYGGLSLVGLGYALSGFIDGDTSANSGLSGSALFTSTASNSSGVGGYDLAYASGLASSLGYSFADAAASTNELTITPRAISLTASAASKVYGESDPTLAVTVAAGSLASGDSLAEVSGVLSRAIGDNVGSYDIALGTGLKAGNYTISFDADNNAFSITPRAISLTASAASKVYGESDPTLAVTVAAGSLASGDSLAEVSGVLSRAIGDNAGSYDIALGTGLKAGNYTISFDANNNAFSITPRPLQVTVNDAERYRGEANPAFSATYTGWAFDDGAQDLQGELQFDTPATPVSAVGEYAVSASGVSSGNYALSFVDGTLQVLAPPLGGDTAARQQITAVSVPLLSFEGDGQVHAGDGPVDALLDRRIARLTADEASGVGVTPSGTGRLLSRNLGIRMPVFGIDEE